MKCEYCEGAIVWRLGNSAEPDRTVCMACGREPKGKEDKMEEKKKTCTKCGQPKLLDEFSKNKSTPDGKERWCKECKKKRQADYRKEKKSIPDFRKPYRSERKIIVKKGGRNKKSVDPKPPSQAIAEGIFLDQVLIKAIKRSVAKVIIGIIEERFV